MSHSSSFSSKKAVVSALSVFALIGVLLAAGAARAEVKKSIAVAPIQWNAGTVSWISGEALHAQMITELNNSGRYRVVERENLDGILKEQDLAAGGRMRKGSGPASGDLEGAQLMIKSVVTDAEEKAGKGGRIGFRGIGVGGKKTEYKVTMDVRIYDTQTGLILDTETVSATQTKGGKSGSIGIGGLSLGGEKSGGDTTGEITRLLIQEAINAIDKQAKKVGWKSNVHGVSGEEVIVIGGSRDGLENGMKFDVYELGEPVKDDDGAILDEGKETKIGALTLTQVKEKISYGKPEGKTPKKGDIVKLKD